MFTFPAVTTQPGPCKWDGCGEEAVSNAYFKGEQSEWVRYCEEHLEIAKELPGYQRSYTF